MQNNMNDEEEVWKEIEGYDYSVSNLGRVRSNPRSYRKTEKILKASPNTTGYLLVQLYKNKQRKSFLIHRLVLLAFLPHPLSEELEVNHKDFDKTNNKISNLEWVTPQENVKHYADSDHSYDDKKRGEGHKASKLTEADVRRIRELWNDGEVKSKQQLANMFCIAESTIRQILSYQSWKHLK